MSFRLVVGLGNPGSEYVSTRHNIGFRVLDAFADNRGAEPWKKERSFKGELTSMVDDAFGKVILLKPQTYMNDSGRCVQKVCSYYKIPPEEMAVVYDELNLELGEVKISLAGSAGGHNGVADILSRIAPRFARVRVGIGQKPLKEMALADYVLSKFSSDEETIVAASMERYVDSLVRLLRDGPEMAMNHINRKKKNDDSNSI
ncbi:aminoacyl-tRNA hydrolase [Pelagicoccus sp. SDUM812003]|uniref:aminoacyl-tRNA hydrolase n=1 Tax=Pelagicoccus sp. SDUM812003 TaxID=3041267 RepID=UPI00280EF66A|nr:aminoacyl-tRNA hydrolase [Pelagicoccus sp. SDUM812003]MDQ8203653.1 aminoacyl-tRNA hydrolase [Pelagicoccus sp. SDUM812003]